MEMLDYFKKFFFIWLPVLFLSCSGKVLHYEKAEQLKKIDEFDQKVKIVETQSSSVIGPIIKSADSTAASVTGEAVGQKNEITRGNRRASETPEATRQNKKKQDQQDENKPLQHSQQDQKISDKSVESNVGKSQDKKKSRQSRLGSHKTKEITEPVGSGSFGASVVEGVDVHGKKEPDLEDGDGFIGRRPIADPFTIGEEVVHKVYYDASLLDLSAGTLSFKVDPFVEVNGRKSYKFSINIKSSDWFSGYYSIDDQVVTLMDYNLLIPRVFELHVKESGQLRETKSFFDFDQMKAFFWEKKVTKKSGEEQRKLEWELLPYSQNVFSSMYYLRLFKWEIGKEYSFRVSDDQENMIFKGKALKKEVLKTEIGNLPAIKIKPEFTVKGAFKPVGDIYIWISDDEYKYVLRIESKIKIGTLVSEVQSIHSGR